MNGEPNISKLRIAVMRFEPGDRVVIRSKERLRPEAAQRITNLVRKWAPKDVDFLVIDEGTSLGVLRRAGSSVSETDTLK